MKIIQYLTATADKYLISMPWSNTFGLARSILALSTFLTLIANSNSVLFPTGAGAEKRLDGILALSLFNLLSEQLWLAKIIAIVILAIAIIGWRPRWVAIPHWYIAYSLFAACPIIDGGDHINALLCMLIIPIALTDGRKWHWDEMIRIGEAQNKRTQFAVLLAWSFILAIRLQVSIIYLHAAEAKLNVEDWANGTAVYYWFTHHYHGAPEWLFPLVNTVLGYPFFVVMITWGTIVFEFILFAALMMRKDDPRRKYLFVCAVIFHSGILIIHGLVSFFCTMVAALILFLYPADKQLEFRRSSVSTIVSALRKKLQLSLTRPKIT